MADTTFSDGVTVLYSSWLQDINDAFYKSTGVGSKGGVLHTGSVGVGYGTGAGGTVTQATSKSTSVTLAKLTGRITMNNASLASNTAVSFTLTNSLIGANDGVVVNVSGGAATSGTYSAVADIPAAGSAIITVRNVSGGALAEAVQLTFNVIKGAVA